MRAPSGFGHGCLMLPADQIMSWLNLGPHPEEGGFFAETYRSEEQIAEKGLPPRYKGVRAFGTAIYYLLTPGNFSAMHRIASDEIFHFYLGDPVEMLLLAPDGTGRIVTLGQDLPKGMRPQVIVPREVWQGSRLVPGGRFALLGATVAPGFDLADYEHARRADLLRTCPAFRDLILSLTSD